MEKPAIKKIKIAKVVRTDNFKSQPAKPFVVPRLSINKI